MLGARAFDLLICLVEHRDRIVTKDELIELVWPDLIVEENNLTVQISALRKLLGATAVSTISGRGYRFSADVIETASETHNAAESDAGLSGKPSIAVMPFTDMSNNPEQQYFCDGITEDIITELSRFHSLFVIARNSTFSYKGKAVEVRTVARELGVQYVLEGSFRRASDRIRVTAQLIDAHTGNHVWAEKYDRVLNDIFDLQEDLTLAIVAAIAPHIEILESEKMRRGRPGNLNAYETAIKAWAMASASFTESDHVLRDEALRLAEEALVIDPHSGLALRTIAYAHFQGLYLGTTQFAEHMMNEAINAATRALIVDPGDHEAHRYKGILLFFSHRYEEGLAHVRRACELNANDARALGSLGFYEAMSGDPETGIRYLTKALRLSPRDPARFLPLNFLGWAYFAAGDYAKAFSAAQQSTVERPTFAPSHMCMVVSSIGQGDFVRAKAEFDVVRAIAPEYTQSRLDGQWVSNNAEFRERATTFARIAAGLEDARTSAMPINCPTN